ncbi:hypothetical protein MAHJHV64_10920 [Mycobacterium avium subsp. hominissuis]|uniref:hypothetical protein n=2 Tax=Mycobacterium avium TaxID=1764 RepID=UPI000CE3D7A5|nr:hypothetical protein [Mycobacterium avium]
MNSMDPEHRDEILAKFPAISSPRPMDPRANTQVRAINRAAQIIVQVWGEDPSAVLFDPARVPALAERADVEAADFHRREGEASRERALGLPPSLHYHAHDGNADYDPDATHEQGAVLIWRVGSKHVTVVRDRWHDQANRDRSMSPAEESASMLQHVVEVDDYRGYTSDEAVRPHPADYELRCNVNIAKDCTAPLSLDVNDYGGGTTRLLPLNRGALVLLFRCCRACEDLAGRIAANTYKSHVIEARADLPRGAVIMPNPEPDVNPDAWA